MFEIEVKVEQESDLYNHFDSRELMPSDDLIAYISNRLEERPLGEKIALSFTGAEIDKEKFKRAMDDFRKIQTRKLVKERQRALANSIRLLITGIIFVIAGITLAGVMNEVVAAVVSTIGSFSIWEAANKWLQVLPALRMKSHVYEVLSDYTLH
ncbi:hypothetical protein [Butyrivibrio sp. INlla16]|uniref:hypothetical protein n=1 Tax=Butyrivibrio sp. INlla16 TaxID=1520807 RepID=UPI000887A374|nr:hypothetical protein [Butyrivibrio sp. INlla16]SDB50072.1 hypothetical protein SAMN02910263_02498 [Butyrivibrio sp. INlla16]